MKQQLSLPAYLASEVEFRAWGKGISDAIAACGLVKSADTGQINWATVMRPAMNVMAGYEIWAFTDALQATLPVFIRVDYGVGAAPDRPGIGVQTGTGTNGAGVLTGQRNTVRQDALITASKLPGDVLPAYVSGSNGRSIGVYFGLDAIVGSSAGGFMVSRTLDGTGTPTADGIVTYAGKNTMLYQVIPAAAGVPASIAGLPVPSTKGQLSSVGTEIAVSVPTVMLGKTLYIDQLVTYEQADIGEFGSFVLNHLGTAKTYLALGDAAGISHGVGAAVCLGLRWE